MAKDQHPRLARCRTRQDRLFPVVRASPSPPMDSLGRGSAAPRSLPATPGKRFSSPALRAFLARQENLQSGVLRCAPAASGAVQSLLALVIAIEAAMDAARYREGDNHGYHRQLH